MNDCTVFHGSIASLRKVSLLRFQNAAPVSCPPVPPLSDMLCRYCVKSSSSVKCPNSNETARSLAESLFCLITEAMSAPADRKCNFPNCKEPGKFGCGGCREVRCRESGFSSTKFAQVGYCNKEHQKADWTAHKAVCKQSVRRRGTCLSPTALVSAQSGCAVEKVGGGGDSG